MQWGYIPVTSNSDAVVHTVQLDKPFPTACVNVVATIHSAVASYRCDFWAQINFLGKDTIKVIQQWDGSSVKPDGIFWQAIGY